MLALLVLLAAPSAATLAQVDAYVERMLAADRVPGAALAVVADGEIVHVRGFGEACPGGPTVGPDTPFMLGSISKSFTGMAIMQLAERGRLDLDATAKQALPGFVVADPEASAAITVDHLLAHTSGLPKSPTAGPEGTLAEHVAALASAELQGPPGEAHRYASTNYQVLGRLVERASGLDFATYVKRNIFDRLGLQSAATAPPANLACGHRYVFGAPRAVPPTPEPGRLSTATLIASAEDLGRYLGAILRREPALLSEDGYETLLTPRVEAEGFGYAMGWRVGPIAGEPAFHHGGVLYDFRGKLIGLPERGMGVAVLTNASSMFGRPTSHHIANGVAALLLGKTPPRAGLPLRYVLWGILGIMALLTVGLIKEAVQTRGWVEQKRETVAAGGVGAALPWLAVAWGVLVPPAVLLGVPLAFGVGWGEMWRAMPDLTGWLWVIAPLSLLLGLVKARLLWRATRG